MGYKTESLSRKTFKNKGKTYRTNLQQYYSRLYDNLVRKLKDQGHQKSQIDKNLSSIFSRTKLPTKTINNQLLKLLDIDKIISINQRSLKQNSEEVRHMRMVASLKSQNQTPEQGQNDQGLRQIDNLVRMARLHFMQMNRPRGDESSSQQNQPNPQVQQFHQLRIQRIRQAQNHRYAP